MKIIIIISISLSISTHLLLSDTRRVPQEYVTIQSAIDASQNSDTVLVSEGIYYENIRYKGKGIVVISRYFITQDWQTILNTVIDGSACANKDTASTVQFLDYEDSTAVIDGFTITGGTGTRYLVPFGTGPNRWQEGAGIILHYSSATIRNNYIINNTTIPQSGVTNGGGGGISSFYGNPTINNNVIASNTSGYAGGIVLNWSRGKVKNNIICHNTCGTLGGGGMMIWQAPQNGGIVENNTVIGNVSTTSGGALVISATDATTIPVIKNNIVWGNIQAVGGQIDNPQFMTGHNNVEDYSSGTNISINPQFQESTFLLSDISPCIDAGDPDLTYNDIEDPLNPGMALLPSKGSLRNDIGAYGGVLAAALPQLDIVDIGANNTFILVQCTTGQQVTARFVLRNSSTKKISIDSITHTFPEYYSINTNYFGKVFDLFEYDSLDVSFNPTLAGTFFDTIKVYPSGGEITDPLILVLQGIAIANYTNIAVSPNWNLVSVPRAQLNDSAAIIFPGLLGNMYAYNHTTGRYDATPTLENGTGYWINYLNTANITINGDVTGSLTVSVPKAGWILVGSRATPVQISSLILSDGAAIVDPSFRYDPVQQVYMPTTVINSGEGVWVNVSKACTITIP